VMCQSIVERLAGKPLLLRWEKARMKERGFGRRVIV